MSASIAAALGGVQSQNLKCPLLHSRLRRWSELLWDRAVAQKVNQKTLVLNEVLPEPLPDRGRVASAGQAVKEKIASQSSALAPRPSGRAGLFAEREEREATLARAARV